MAKSKRCAEKFTKCHRDGTIGATGQTWNDIPVGHGEWFRKDGTKVHPGSVDQEGNQVVEWTTYDRAGAVVKVTDMNQKWKPGQMRRNRQSKMPRPLHVKEHRSPHASVGSVLTVSPETGVDHAPDPDRLPRFPAVRTARDG